MNKTAILLLIIILFSLNLIAQSETDNWYFGSRIGLNFSKNDPEIITNSNMFSPNGSATISDKKGKLILYTNGVSIWNENHFSINPGGMTPFTAGGDLESTQNSIIIPLPASDNIFYVFTISGDNSTKGLYYNIIDTTSGRPIIIEEKKRLLTHTTGKISAVHHKDGKSIWIVALGTDVESDAIKYDTFFSYKVSFNGLSRNPIKSDAKFNFIEPQKGGALKLSPNGTLMAVANYTTGIELYKFDSFTGIISDSKHITVMGPPADFTNPGIDPIYTYGLEFSNDSNFLYTTAIFNDPSNSGEIHEFVIQYKVDDLSKYLLDKSIISDTENYYNSLQLASNGKIYKTNTLATSFKNPSNYLSVINNPSKEGRASGFQEIGLEFNDENVYHGLPNFIQSYFRTRILTNDGCLNSSIYFDLDSYATITNVEWDFGDGTTSSEIKPEHVYNSIGTFNVIAKITVNNREIIKHKKVTIFALPELISNQKLEQCDIDFDGISNFNLTTINEKISKNYFNETFVFYKKLEDAEQEINEIKTPENFTNTIKNQEIFVRVTNQNNCYTISSFTVEASFVDVGSIADMFACDNLTGEKKGYFNLKLKLDLIRTELNIPRTYKLRLFPSQLKAQTTTNEIDLRFTSVSTTIWLRIDTDKGCGGIAPISLIVNNNPIINLQDSYTICYFPNLKPPVIISADASNDSFEWKNSKGTIISTNKDFTLNTIGEFSLTVYKTENGLQCSSSKTFTVINPDKPFFSTLTANTEDETNNIVDVSINGNSNYEFSLDNINFFGNATSYTFTKVTPGLRTVYIRDLNNCEQPVQANVSVIGFKKYFTPNGDNNNDFWNVKGLDPVLFKSINVRIFNRYGKLIGSITDFSSQGWDGNFNGKPAAPNNYWFTAKIIDKDDKIIQESGNFSLIRN